MKVILFIGHHKVGSTSLEDFLARNSAALARAGILYPAVDFEAMSLMLASALGRHDPEEYLPINAREPHNALAFRMLADHGKGEVPPFHKGLPSRGQMVRAIRKQIMFLQPHTVILAGEVLANFSPAGTALIEALIDIFPPDSDFTVLATLRRIDDYLVSWHGQRLKFGHKVAPLRENGARHYFDKIHFDYRLMLEGWLMSVPNARFILRDYAQVQAAGGSVADFITQSDLTLPEGLIGERRANESLHRGIYESVRRGNQALPPEPAKELRQVLHELSPKLGLPKSSEIEMFGEANRQIMLERFRPIHDFLVKVSGRDPFFPDLEEVARIRPIPEADVFQDTLNNLHYHLHDFFHPEIRDFLKSLQPKTTPRGGMRPADLSGKL